MAEYVLSMTGDAVNAALTKAQTDLSYTEAQTLTEAQKQQVRNAIGAMESKSVVTYTSQSLTTAQQQIVRQNINAASATDVSALGSAISSLQAETSKKLDYTQAQALTSVQQAQTRSNIGINPIEYDPAMKMSIGLDSDGRLWAETLETPDITNWSQVQQIVVSGSAPRLFEIGDQFVVNKATEVTAVATGNITNVEVDLQTFITGTNKVEPGFYTFIYKSAKWYYIDEEVDLENYGITFDGTPIDMDTIIIEETVETITFDVLDFDYDTPTTPTIEHTMTLQAHDIYNFNTFSFDAREAFYYCSSTLTAGTYYFNMGTQPWYTGDSNKDMQFTLTQEAPAGSQLVMNQAYNATLIGSTITVYGPTGLAIQQVTVTNDNSGTNLGTIGQAAVGNFNSIDRSLLGSNNWEQSCMRRYLNSDAAGANPGENASWYDSPSTVWDRPVQSTLPGFLYGLDPSFVAILQDVKKRVSLNSPSDEDDYADLDETIFLISMTECGLGANENIYETSFGTDTTFTNIKTTPYQLYTDITSSDRIKYDNSTARVWWTRGTYTDDCDLRSISATGTLGYSQAYTGQGIVPALCIG